MSNDLGSDIVSAMMCDKTPSDPAIHRGKHRGERGSRLTAAPTLRSPLCRQPDYITPERPCQIGRSLRGGRCQVKRRRSRWGSGGCSACEGTCSQLPTVVYPDSHPGHLLVVPLVGVGDVRARCNQPPPSPHPPPSPKIRRGRGCPKGGVGEGWQRSRCRMRAAWLVPSHSSSRQALPEKRLFLLGLKPGLVQEGIGHQEDGTRHKGHGGADGFEHVAGNSGGNCAEAHPGEVADPDGRGYVPGVD